MKGLINISITLLLTVGLSYTVSAQDDRPITTDTRGWIGVSIKKQVIKNLDLKVEQALRWKEEVSELYRNFTQASLKYKIVQWASVKGGYRYAYGDEGYSRYFGAISLQTELSRFKLKTTSRFEHNFEREEGVEDSSRWRQKGHVSYKKKKWRMKPFVFAEMFFPFEEGEFQSRNRLRYGCGADYELTKYQSLSLSLFFQDTSKKKSLERQSVVSFDYQYEF